MPNAGRGLWLFAGCNGAGKSTFIAKATGRGGTLEGTRVLNPDQLTKELLAAEGFDSYQDVPPEVYRRCFIRAAEEMEQTARVKLLEGETVCIETVLSTGKYLSLLDESRAPLYLVYVTLRSPELAQQRVLHRVALGGHPVPPDKIVERYQRSHENLAIFSWRAKHFWVIDNSSNNAHEAPKLLAEGADRRLLPGRDNRITRMIGSYFREMNSRTTPS